MLWFQGSITRPSKYSFASLAARFRQAVAERRVERRRAVAEAHTRVGEVFDAWYAEWRRLDEIPAQNWANPDFAQALVRERAAYRLLAGTLRTVRLESLPG